MLRLLNWLGYKLACVQLWLVDTAADIAADQYADGELTNYEYLKTRDRMLKLKKEALEKKEYYGNSK